MSNISKTTSELKGTWKVIDGKIIADSVCERIEQLISSHLSEITRDSSGWDVLYRDPDDGRYWELVYLEGHLPGGGPPTLRFLKDAEVKNKYGRIAEADRS